MSIIGNSCTLCPDPAWVQQNNIAGNTPGVPPAAPIASNPATFPQVVVDCYDDGLIIYTNNTGGPWDACSTASNPDGKTVSQDNTGVDIPAILTDPTTPVIPIARDVTFQEYDNGCVISTYDGAVWTNKSIITHGVAQSVVVADYNTITNPGGINRTLTPVEGEVNLETYNNGFLFEWFDSTAWQYYFMQNCCPESTQNLTNAILSPADSEIPTTLEIQAFYDALAADDQGPGTQITYTSPLGKYYTWIVDVDGNTILHESPGNINAVLPAEIICEPIATTIPTLVDVDTFVDQNLEFSDIALTGITNSCRNTVQGSETTGAISNSSGSYNTRNGSSATGTNSIALGGSGNTTIGEYSVVGGINNIVSGIRGFTTGQGNTVDGGWSNVSGNGNITTFTSNQNQITGDTNTVSSSNNTVSGTTNNIAGDNNTISGLTNILLAGANNNQVAGDNNSLAVNSIRNTVSGRLNLLSETADDNQISGIGNQIDGFRNTVAGQNNNVDGGWNTISGSNNTIAHTASLVVGDNNQLLATFNGGQNIVGGQNNILDSTGYISANNIVGGLSNIIGGADNGVFGRRNTTGDNSGNFGNIVGGNDHQLLGPSNANLVVGQTNTLAVDAGNNLIAGQENITDDLRHGIMVGLTNIIPAGLGNRSWIGGSYTQAAVDNCVTFGNAAAGPALTSNRTIQLNMGTGQGDFAGAVNTGVVFPGCAEPFENAEESEIPFGTIVSVIAGKKGAAVRAAIKGDKVGKDGVVRFGVVRAPGSVDIHGDCSVIPQFEIDIWGAKIIGEDGLPKKNPEFAKSKILKKSEDRDNFAICEIAGQAPALVNGFCPLPIVSEVKDGIAIVMVG